MPLILKEKSSYLGVVDIRARIVIDPAVLHGKPIIRGTRVPLSIVVGSLAGGMTEVDELATHHYIQEVYVVDTIVHAIGSQTITYRSTGSINVILQFGSNSDVERGDGAELQESFPFSCDIEVPLVDPWDLELAETRYGVDVSSWRDAMKPDDVDLMPDDDEDF